jgi:hypothetical protein
MKKYFGEYFNRSFPNPAHNLYLPPPVIFLVWISRLVLYNKDANGMNFHFCRCKSLVIYEYICI